MNLSRVGVVEAPDVPRHYGICVRHACASGRYPGRHPRMQHFDTADVGVGRIIISNTGAHCFNS